MSLGLPVLVLGSCGPQVEPGTHTDGDTSATSTGPTVVPTTGSTTTPTPGVTTDDTLDTGTLDTGEGWMDLPEDCSLFERDCPPGYKCMPWADDGGGEWNDTRCVPVAEEPGAVDDPCTIEGEPTSGLDDCDETSMCWDVDPETNIGTCTPFCIGSEADPYCADRCRYCAISADASILLCLTNCDPLLQNCGEGQACYPVSERFVCAPDASPPDTMIGSPCELINVCPPGLVCMSGQSVPGCETVGCCTPVCPVEGPDPCPGLLPGTECVPFYEDGVPDNVGCLPNEPGVCFML